MNDERTWNVSVQIILNYTIPITATSAQEAAEQVEQMDNDIFDYTTIQPSDIWINTVTETTT